MASLPQSLGDNPIARAELSHQQRASLSLKWRRWSVLFSFALGTALLSSLSLLFALPQLARLLGVNARDLEELLRGWFGTLTVLIGGLIMIHHLSFSVAGLQLASTSIAREKQGRTWESLLLTGVDARRIVYGKWWATMKTLWQVYRPLLLLRFCLALWVGTLGASAQANPYYPQPPLLSVILIAVVTAVFPLTYTAFAGTLGLLASLVVRSEVTAYRVGMAFHFGTIVLSLAMVMVSFMLPFGDIEPALASMIPALFITPLDGGMLAIIGTNAGSGASSFYYVLGLFACMALYAALTWVSLRGAQALTVRQRALPPI
ncbi:MAG: hypothetical protein IT319_01250 [Anaerolineae bacterium]|nr:hypothetical protein [Anaerolineae bacterium]